MGEAEMPHMPFAGEFTPGQLGPDALFELLEIVKNSESRAVAVEKIRSKWFETSAQRRGSADEKLGQQKQRASNVLIGMGTYGLVVSRKSELTGLGLAVLSLSAHPQSAYDELARFLLTERRGVELLEFAEYLRKRDGSVSKRAIDQELVARGYKVPTNSGDSGKLRAWLEVFGVVDSEWNVDQAKLRSLVGFDLDDVDDWGSLTNLQRDVIATLSRRWEGNRTPIASKDLLALLRANGTHFDSAQVKRQIYEPLAAKGWIAHTVAQAGRGGKGGTLEATQRIIDLDVDQIDGLKLGPIPSELLLGLVVPLTEVLGNLLVADTYIKGIALELLALRLAVDLGLTPADLRLRGIDTGGAEVDLVAEATHLQFSRWLFQCKNVSSPVPVAVLAKEVGLATILRANVVVIVTTGTFTRSVRDLAARTIEQTAIQVILLAADDLNDYATKGPDALRKIVRRSTNAAASSKRNQLASFPDDTGSP
jgi:hypothetical protein